MLVAAAVCPGPPALVPALTGGDAGLDDLRAACDRALAVLSRQDIDRLVVLGAGEVEAVLDPHAPSDLHRWGGAPQLTQAPAAAQIARTPAASGSPAPASGLSSSPAPLPLPLALGQFLLTRTPVAAREVSLRTVDVAATPRDALALGRELARSARRTAFLVIADGATCHDEQSPTAYDPRAKSYDAGVAAALGAADAAALARLDPDLSHQLGAQGRAPWQVLAGAVQADGPQSAPDAIDIGAGRGARLRSELLMSVAPYGVGYHVATWWRG